MPYNWSAGLYDIEQSDLTVYGETLYSVVSRNDDWITFNHGLFRNEEEANAVAKIIAAQQPDDEVEVYPIQIVEKQDMSKIDVFTVWLDLNGNVIESQTTSFYPWNYARGEKTGVVWAQKRLKSGARSKKSVLAVVASSINGMDDAIKIATDYLSSDAVRDLPYIE